ncbi:MAG: hypothetical protein WD334_10270, partial [Chitinophagales bacterium]
MKTYFILILTIFYFAFPSIAAETFEGKLTLSGKTTGKNAGEYSFPLLIQGDKLLFQADEKMKVVINSKSGDMHILTENQGNKMAIKLNLKYLESAGGLKTFMGSSAPFDMSTIERMDDEQTMKKTSETKNINGQQCRKYLVDDEAWSGHIWVSENPPYDFSGLYSVLDIKSVTGLPLSGSLKSKKDDSTQDFDMKFEKMSLNSEQFSIGSNVQIVDVSMMLQNQDPKQVEEMIKQMLPP